MAKTSKVSPDTLVTTVGRDPEAHHGTVNPPVYHASTIVFPTLADVESSFAKRYEHDHFHYGRFGTPTGRAFEQAVAALEGGARALAVSSGLAAAGLALLASCRAGDHVLMVDSAYGPTRSFCTRVLARFGVDFTFYDPEIGAGIGTLIRENTRAIYLESPGSITFEVQDVPAIANTAKAAGLTVILDNTWATPLYFRPFDHGVDIVVHAATKYLVGHSDAMLGVLVTDETHFRAVRDTATIMGNCVGPDDAYLALRGLRTLAVRLHRHQRNGLTLAHWLEQRPEVERVLHPALPSHPGHDLWRRDFSGASGLFSILLKPVEHRALAAMLDGMALFAMGYSWGGFESLIIPEDPANQRSAVPWSGSGPLLRLHAGLEDPDDLIADLAAGFDRLSSAR